METLSRRQMVLGTAAVVAAPTFAACGSNTNYEAVARSTWRHGNAQASDQDPHVK